MIDFTQYKDKINPNKEYEIVGQDILNVINTIDSLENEVDSLSKYINFIDNNHEWYYDYSHANTIDTLHDTVQMTQYDTVYVNMYTNKAVNDNKIFENYSFYIVFGIMMILAIWWKIKNK